LPPPESCLADHLAGMQYRRQKGNDPRGRRPAKPLREKAG